MNRVAVIICTYIADKVDYLTAAIDSMLEQSLACDLLILKNGSVSDEVDALLADYATRSNVIIFNSETNVGLAKGLNILIDYAINRNYEYIARMDSDDIAYVDRLKKQINHLDLHSNIDVLGTSCHEFGASFALNEKHLPKTHVELKKFSITRCPFIHPTVVFRGSIFKDKIRYPENTTLTEDMALWFELLNKGFHFSNINDVLLSYRLNENTINRRKGLKKAFSEVMVRTKFMIKLNQVSLKNIFLIASRFVFHMLPSPLLKYMYRNMR